jgi:hypothetical protein
VESQVTADVFAQAGLEPPASGEAVRVPLAAMRFHQDATGRLRWSIEQSKDVGAYLELLGADAAS